MKFTIKAASDSREEGVIEINGNNISFGVTAKNDLPSPADLLVSAFAACCLKNVERFSEFMHYNYDRAEISVEATRKDKPPMMEKISFILTVHTNDRNINAGLLLRNIQKFGTIYNTLNAVCEINGEVLIKNE
jgi:uncharacterized OsmC-like protein